ncbi:alpha/beta hydrolase [Niabella yanshanensis]|uniref:Alpha/beta hydrolase n=1 Tax=Niabella yanshanensis TaxID=577386 RepID=A0ABZ0W9F7_9BACT|nr:alpha/beta hydrolase [Niabella yanshanensis]WQD39920.1 alpha/beta hydrolase [Niabella yanshanensis]
MEAVIEGRISFEQIGNNYPKAPNVDFDDIMINDVSCRWVKPDDAIENEVLVYIHGGAFIYGSLQSHTAMVTHIAGALKRRILMIEYRLAPEHPYPAGLNDCVGVITKFFAANSGIEFGIMGDSAGGGLTIATQIQLRDQGGPMPRYSIVVSPWVDLTCVNESYNINKSEDSILTREFLQWAAGLYAGNSNILVGLLSPVKANLTNLPSTLIVYGTAEILADDSIHLHRQLVEAGVDAELTSFDDEQHVWPFTDIHSTASQKVLEQFATFANKHNGSTVNS